MAPSHEGDVKDADSEYVAAVVDIFLEDLLLEEEPKATIAERIWPEPEEGEKATPMPTTPRA